MQQQTQLQNTFYLGLYNLDLIETTDSNGVNVYTKVDWRKSGNQEYFKMLRAQFNKRGNWIELNETQVLHASLVQFSFTNWSKLQTKSVIHNRILLDTLHHFISSKYHFYEMFQDQSFIPEFIEVDVQNIESFPSHISKKMILKPSAGSLSLGIKLVDTTNTPEDLMRHMRAYKEYTNWTLSTLHVAKTWTDGCIVSNRIYYLVRKMKVNNQFQIDGYWFDECIHYKACVPTTTTTTTNAHTPTQADLKKQFLTNIANGESSAEDFFLHRVLSHTQYLSLFTRQEYETIKEKLTSYMKTITRKIAQHLTCSNDYLDNFNDIDENKNMSFHLYGIDSLIMDDLSIKFVEINGAPTIVYDAALGKIDYSVMMDELLKLTADVIFLPTTSAATASPARSQYGVFKDTPRNKKVKLFDRKFIPCGTFFKPVKIPVYIAKTVHDTYPFIANALLMGNRADLYQRIKNPHSKHILLFYGMRDRYVHQKSSMQFYDELAEYQISCNGRNAKILNKIQGITYYLASKDRLYDMCEKNHASYIPESMIFNVDTDHCQALANYIAVVSTSTRFIVKPVYGSQGKGIFILSRDNAIDLFVNNMKQMQQRFGYAVFIISVYIDNPKLYTDVCRRKQNVKFNLRFYVLIHLRQSACVENHHVNKIQIYVLNHVQIYFAMLPYDVCVSNVAAALLYGLNLNKCDPLNEIVKNLPLAEIDNFVNLTNLQIVKNVARRLNIDIPLQQYVMLLEDMLLDDPLKLDIVRQGERIIHDTLSSVQQHLRHLNRFVSDSSAFNLIAYDTMLDCDNQLHLIEINRGPDLAGLKLTLGEKRITNVFKELFDIVLADVDVDVTDSWSWRKK